ncbi:MAG: PKD domain-containing protein [Thermoplasmatales archaeon]|nr:PKD domain-containing protein [Thermoplasmatales archaeon]
MTATDLPAHNAGVKKVWYYVNDVGNYSETLGATVTFDLTGYPEGMHTIYYGAEDNIGNNETANNIIVWIDDSEPLVYTMETLYPAGQLQAKNGDTVTLRCEVVELPASHYSGIFTVLVNVSGVTNIPNDWRPMVNVGGYYWELNVTVNASTTGEWEYNCAVNATDNVSNSNVTGVICLNVYVDNEVPTPTSVVVTTQGSGTSGTAIIGDWVNITAVIEYDDIYNGTEFNGSGAVIVNSTDLIVSAPMIHISGTYTWYYNFTLPNGTSPNGPIDESAHVFTVTVRDDANNSGSMTGTADIDNARPASTVTLTPNAEHGTNYTDTPLNVTWGPEGGCTDIVSYTIWIKDGDFIWYVWLEDVPAGYASLTIEHAHRYWFMSIATDNAGNAEIKNRTDGMDNETASAQDQFDAFITGDLYPPTASIVIMDQSSGSTIYTNNPVVNLNLTATDDVSYIWQMRFSNNNINWSAWEAWSTTKLDWNLTDPDYGGTDDDGYKNVWFQVKDPVGHIATASGMIFLDRAVPVNLTITINSGENYTNNQIVTLTLTAEDPASGLYQMRFSNNGVSWSAWESWSTTKAGWDLTNSTYGGTDTDGTKYVYFQVMDNALNIADAVNDTIFLDRIAPVITVNLVDYGWFGSDPGAVIDVDFDSGTGCNLDFAEYNVSGFWTGSVFTSDCSVWTANWALEPWADIPDGVNTITIRVVDLAGNEATGVIYFRKDTIKPTALSIIVIDCSTSNETWTNEALVNLINLSWDDGLNGSGVNVMRFSNNGTNWSAWFVLATIYNNWNLTDILYGGNDDDGIKTVYFQVRDNVFLNSSSIQDTIFLDRVAPVNLTIEINLNATYTNNHIVTLTIDAEDPLPASGLYQMCFSNNNVNWSDWETWSTTRTGWNLTAYGGTDADGNKTVYFQVRDNALNVADAVSDTIFLDRVAPTTLTILVNGNAVYTNNQIVTLTLSAIDPAPASGLYQMRFSNNNVDWSAWEIWSATKVGWNLTDPAYGGTDIDGTKYVYFQVMDNALNVAGPVNDTIILDRVTPNSGVTSVRYTHNVTFIISWDGTDATSGIASYNISYRSYNATINNTWMSLVVSNVPGNYTMYGKDGYTYLFRSIATDNAGNIEVKTGDVYDSITTVDTTSPIAVSINITTTYSNSLVDIILNATDDLGTGVWQMRFSNNNISWSAWETWSTTKDNWDLTDTAYGGNDTEGTKYVYFQVRDYAENPGNKLYDDVILDMTAPISKAYLNGVEVDSGYIYGWFTADVNVTITAIDNLSGMYCIYYEVYDDDTGDFLGYDIVYGDTASFNISDYVGYDGTFVVVWLTVDNADNIDSDGLYYWVVGAAIDTTPPTTTDNAPASWQTSFPTIILTPTDATSGPNATYYKLWLSGTPEPTSWTVGTSIVITTDGVWNISYYSDDVAGNVEAVTSKQVFVDTTDPVTTDNAPSGWQTVSPVVVTLTATDDTSGVNKTEYKVWLVGTTEPTSYTEGTTVTISTDGKWYIKYRSVDNATNAETPTTKEVWLDTTVLTPTMTALDDFTQGITCTVNWGAVYDANSGIAKYRVQASTDSTFDVVDKDAWTNLTSYTFTGLGEFKYYYRVCAKDNAGNTGVWSEPVNSTQDNSPPGQPTMNSEPLSGYTQGLSNTVSCSIVSDAGVGDVEYYFECATDAGFGTIVSNSGWTTNNYTTFTNLDDGQTYYYRVKARDAFLQETGYSGYVYSTQDDSPPVSVLASVSPYWHNAVVSVVSTADETGSGVKEVALHYKYSADDIIFGNWTPFGVDTDYPYQWNFNFPAGEGYYKLCSVATDLAMNTESYPSTYDAIAGYDVTLPTLDDDAPSVWKNTNVTIALTPDDALSGVDVSSTGYKLWLVGTAEPGTWTLGATIEIATDGKWYIRYHAVDNAGNENISTVKEVWVDKTEPSVNTGADVITNALFTQNATASDSLSGIATYLWEKISGPGTVTFGTNDTEDTTVSADTDGTYVIRLTVTDNAGNSKSDDFELIWDIVNPTVDAGTDKIKNAVFTQDATVTDTSPSSGIATYLWEKVSGPGTITFGTSDAENTTIAASADGTYVIRLTVTDNAGNSMPGEFTLTWDVTPPTTTDDAPTTWQTSTPVTVTLTPSDLTSGVAITYYRISSGNWLNATWNESIEIPLYVDGIYYIQYYSVDNASNEEGITNITVKIDQTPPTTSDNAPSGWQTSFQTITLDPNDVTSGVAQTYYKLWLIAGTEPTNWTEGDSVEIISDGKWYVKYYSEDDATNAETPLAPVEVWVDTADPVTSDDAPVGWQTSFVTVALTTEADLSGVAHTYYKLWLIAGNEPTNWTEGASVEITADGKWYIRYYSIDDATNAETSLAPIEVWVDTADPVTSDNAPSGWQTSFQTITLSPSDVTSGVAQTYYKLWLVTGTEPDTYTEGASVEITSDGKWYVKYYSEDVASNKETPLTPIEVWIDTTSPADLSIVITGTGGTAYTTSTTVTLVLNATDDGSGIAKYLVSNDGVTWKTYNASWTLLSGDGDKTVYFKAKDVAGNENTTSATILLDTTPPIATIGADKTAIYTGETVQFTGSTSEPTGATYSWNFGDETPTSTEQSPSHKYTVKGIYTVTLTVTDVHGLTSTTQIPVTVKNKPQPPVFIPGFEVLALIAAMGVAVILLRKKH